MNVEIKNGTDAIRATVLARARKGHLFPIARDLQVGVAALEAFAHGQGKLSPEILKALTKELYNSHTEFNAELDLLQPANKAEAKSLGIKPPTLAETGWNPLKVEHDPLARAPLPLKPQPIKPQKKRPAGWVD